MPAYADIAFPTAVRKVFTYHIDEAQASQIQPGIRVWVPLRNHFSIGLVVRVHDEKPSFKTRPIRKILDKKPILSKELLDLTEWIHRFYFSSWGEVIQAALPAGLNFVSKEYVRLTEDIKDLKLSEAEAGIINDIRAEGNYPLDEARKRWKGTSLYKNFNKLLRSGLLEVWEEPDMKVEVRKERAWAWAEDRTGKDALKYLEDQEKETKWLQTLRYFAERELPKRNSELTNVEEVSSYTLNKLKDEGWIRPIELEVLPEQLNWEFDPDSIKALNKEQQDAFKVIDQKIQADQFSNFLLYGVTGSGKTEVYIHALKKVLEKGKGGIVLVPEIALTPQTVSRFYRIFGEQIAVLHSRMTNRERLQAWKELESGVKKIAIGPRSAVFAPVQDLGIIILDEEHDGSYKQEDPSPRYHARETAIMRARTNDAVMIMGSATPSLQSLNMAAKGKAQLLELKKRHAEALMPEVEIIDLKQYKGAMKGELSAALFEAMTEALSRNEQVILLFNRRGFASYLQCEQCGHIPQSPECSVSLTYHKHNNMLMCHYSGYARKADKQCEECGSTELIIKGAGTQKVEEQLHTYFPDAKVIRFDRDSTSRKGAHEAILSSFGRGEADIMIGTQLVAKGLDFPNVTVVGVIDADTELAFPSFQSTERMYQLLSQVAGRSGRGEKPGKVLIQTRMPENTAVQYARHHDHEGFARQEMGFRKPLNYPPYSRLIKFICKGPEEKLVQEASQKIHDLVQKALPEQELLGPSPSPISWVNKNYLWELTLKIEPDKGSHYIEKVLSTIMEHYGHHSRISASKVRVNINVDAIR